MIEDSPARFISRMQPQGGAPTESTSYWLQQQSCQEEHLMQNQAANYKKNT